MTRQLLVIALTALCLLAQPRPSFAGFWDWLEEYSGPGPFKGISALFTACLQNKPVVTGGTPVTRMWLSPVPSRDSAPGAIPTLKCVYADVSSFTADADPMGQGFPEVKLRMYDFGGSLRIADGLDIGAGLGWVAYLGDDMPDNQMTLTPIRIVGRPLILLSSRSNRHPAAGIISLYYKQTYVPGPYTGDDFHQVPPPGVAKFSATGGELLGSFGVIFDLTSVASRVRIPWWK